MPGRKWSVLSVVVGVLVAMPILHGGSNPPGENKTPNAGDVITNTIGMKLAYIPPGKFLMGSAKEEKDRSSNEFLHEVEITRGFYLSIHKVTIGQFKQFVADEGYRTEAEKIGKGGHGYNEGENQLEGPKPQYTWKNTGWPQTDNHPVVNVTWNDAKAFCAWLSKREKKAYRLPSEAQWEYACRAGTKTAYQSGDDVETLVQVGNVPDATFRAKLPEYAFADIKGRDGYVFTAPVGQFKKNDFGLFDMHGNVREWCEDWYEAKYYENSPKKDPLNLKESSSRVLRGGSWLYFAKECRSAHRDGLEPAFQLDHLGFRLARGSVD